MQVNKTVKAGTKISSLVSAGIHPGVWSDIDPETVLTVFTTLNTPINR
jgi:hypothetical protein